MKGGDMDEVFKALADPNRRKILDLVRATPGMNVNDLTQHFEFSRFATMKHLRILEQAKLVIAKKEWKDKRLYLNAVPIQMIYERWMSGYAGRWAGSLTNLKDQIEKEKP